MTKSLILLPVMTALLASCASAPRGIPRDRLERILDRAPHKAQPSTIVATESAMARAAREDGQFTALREYAADGAMIHGLSGAIPADGWLSSQSNPDQAIQWQPKAIWMSCDGALAISQGRFEAAAGIVGTFVTVWQRQRGNEYKWIYDATHADNPQPPPPAPEAPPEPGEIRVTALDSVEGNVADCPRRDVIRPDRPASFAEASGVSPDGTLAYRWQHVGEGDRRFTATWLHEGEWLTATEQSWPAAGGQ